MAALRAALRHSLNASAPSRALASLRPHCSSSSVNPAATALALGLEEGEVALREELLGDVRAAVRAVALAVVGNAGAGVLGGRVGAGLRLRGGAMIRGTGLLRDEEEGPLAGVRERGEDPLDLLHAEAAAGVLGVRDVKRGRRLERRT